MSAEERDCENTLCKYDDSKYKGDLSLDCPFEKIKIS